MTGRQPTPRNTIRSALTDREMMLGSWIACWLIAAMVASGLAVGYFFLDALAPDVVPGSIGRMIRAVAIGVVGLGCLVTVVAFVLHARARGAAAATLVANNFRFCPHCVYDVREIEAWPCACPECGVVLESSETVTAHWRRQYGALVRRAIVRARRKRQGRYRTRSALGGGEALVGKVVLGCIAISVIIFAYSLAAAMAPALRLRSVPSEVKLVVVVVWVVSLLGMLPLLLVQGRLRGRAAKRLVAGDLEPCPYCVYDLARVESIPGVCPECGGPIESRAWVREHWREVYQELLKRGQKGNADATTRRGR